jgi:hypothetical protein
MAKKQSSFNYDELDSATQDFLRQKEKDIQSLISEVGFNLALTDRYRIGQKVVEVRSDLEKNNVKCWTVWIAKVFDRPQPAIYDGFVYLYKYTSEYLGGIVALEDNPRIAYSVFCRLGRPGTSDEIKQKFAGLIKSGTMIGVKEVTQAIDEHKAKIQQVDDDLNFGSDNRIEAQTNNHAIEVIRTHTKTQAMLAKLGGELCDFVWIAPDNRSESWQNERLGDLSIHELPKIATDPAEQKIIPYIDVIWLGKNKRFKAVFEIECTTSIYSGLLRMTDLMELYGSLNFSFYIVVPESRVKRVKEQLSRPTFKALELDKKCKWIIIEELEQCWQEMMKWGRTPDIIDNIAYSLIDE